MASEKVVEFTNDNWDQEVLQNDQPVLVDFWAPWCAPCRILTPIVERLAEQYAGKVTIGKLNIDDSQDVAVRYAVSGVPQIYFFKGGELRQKLVGLSTEGELSKALDQLLAS